MNEKIISVEDARKQVQKLFPIPGYIDGALDTSRNIANTIRKYLNPGAKILDFGSGPCDKTAVIQLLGYKCSAFDDLQDEWLLMAIFLLKKNHLIWLCPMMY